jgi:hypothetical protein
MLQPKSENYRGKKKKKRVKRGKEQVEFDKEHVQKSAVSNTFLEVSTDVNRSSNWSVFIVFILAFSALMTALATETLNLWRLITFSSKVPRIMRRWTFTTFR